MKTINFILSNDGTIIGGSPGGLAWLAEREVRLAAENAELRNDGMIQGHLLRQLLERLMAHVGEIGQSEGALDVLVRVLAERDRLRALVALATPIVVAYDALPNSITDPSLDASADKFKTDPDGQAAAEWLEAEKAKAAELWKAAVSAQHVYYRATNPEWRPPLDDLLESAMAWLADREAKARAAGRRQGLAEAAELVEAADCTCYRRDEAEICAPQCPLALASMIRDLCPEGSELK